MRAAIRAKELGEKPRPVVFSGETVQTTLNQLLSRAKKEDTGLGPSAA